MESEHALDVVPEARTAPVAARTLETGNAAAAGAASRGWFVGDLAAWAAQRGAAHDDAGSPRQSAHLEVKWVVHPPGDVRPAWAEPDGCWTMSILVDGDFRIAFRELDGADHVVALRERGDYALWYGPAYAHSWRSDGGATVLSVRWPVAGQGATSVGA